MKLVALLAPFLLSGCQSFTAPSDKAVAVEKEINGQYYGTVEHTTETVAAANLDLADGAQKVIEFFHPDNPGQLVARVEYTANYDLMDHAVVEKPESAIKAEGALKVQIVKTGGDIANTLVRGGIDYVISERRNDVTRDLELARITANERTDALIIGRSNTTAGDGGVVTGGGIVIEAPGQTYPCPTVAGLDPADYSPNSPNDDFLDSYSQTIPCVGPGIVIVDPDPVVPDPVVRFFN